MSGRGCIIRTSYHSSGFAKQEVPFLALISGWMDNGTNPSQVPAVPLTAGIAGNVKSYLRQYPTVDREALLLDIVLGLEHLHGM